MDKKLNFEKISLHEGPKTSPGFLLWNISTTWRGSIEEVLKDFSLTHPQFVILACLGWLTRKGDHVTQAMVGKMAGLDPNTTSQIMRGLEKRKLLKRLASIDGRAKNPLLTERGQRVVAQALPAVESADRRFFSSLSETEAGTLIYLFQKLSE